MTTRREMLVGALALVLAPSATLLGRTSPSPYPGQTTPPPPSSSDSYQSLQADMESWYQTLDFNALTDAQNNAHYDQLKTLVNRGQRLYDGGASTSGSTFDPLAEFRSEPDLAALVVNWAPNYTVDVEDPRAVPSPHPTQGPTNASRLALGKAVAGDFDPAAGGAIDYVKGIIDILVGAGLADAVITVLEENFAAVLNEIVNAAASGNKGRLAAALARLLDTIFSKAFGRLLIRQVGESVAKKIITKILAKAFPFVGWAILIGEILIWIYNKLKEKKKEQVVAPAFSRAYRSANPLLPQPALGRL